VEGVGGLLVPLGPQLSAADLPLQLKIPAILVVGMRLGCLNHALLTAEAMRERGIVLAGWVANQIDPKMRHYQENIKTLSGRIAAPLLGELQYSVSSNLRQMATKLDFSRLALFL
jgi:dethiobiotin synthetase